MISYGFTSRNHIAYGPVQYETRNRIDACPSRTNKSGFFTYRHTEQHCSGRRTNKPTTVALVNSPIIIIIIMMEKQSYNYSLPNLLPDHDPPLKNRSNSRVERPICTNIRARVDWNWLLKTWPMRNTRLAEVLYHLYGYYPTLSRSKLHWNKLDTDLWVRSTIVRQ